MADTTLPELATPLPWSIKTGNGRTSIVGPCEYILGYPLVAELSEGNTTNGNAARIIAACNSHDALVRQIAALREAADFALRAGIMSQSVVNKLRAALEASHE